MYFFFGVVLCERQKKLECHFLVAEDKQSTNLCTQTITSKPVGNSYLRLHRGRHSSPGETHGAELMGVYEDLARRYFAATNMPSMPTRRTALAGSGAGVCEEVWVPSEYWPKTVAAEV